MEFWSELIDLKMNLAVHTEHSLKLCEYRAKQDANSSGTFLTRNPNPVEKTIQNHWEIQG